MLACALLVSMMHSSARSESRPDSLLARRWSAVYRSCIDIERMSISFPWNDGEALSQTNDRLALLGEISSRGGFSLFAKGATGFRLGGEYQESQFVLEQAHAGFVFFGGAVRGRLFSRERVYRTDQRLLKLLSDESRFVAGRGEGLTLEMSAGNHASLHYIESTMKEESGNHGGLPSFYGSGDILRMIRIEGFQRSRWHAGFVFSQIRSIMNGDRITVGSDIGFRVRGVDILAELARTQSGDWEALRENALFDVKLRGARLDDLGALFSENDAFAAEIDGLSLDAGKLGAAGIVPGYRFSGEALVNREGEIAPGMRKSYALAWWKPAKYDALVSIDASDGRCRNLDFSSLVGSARMRYRGGFELRESILCRTGERSSAAVSLVDDNALSRVAVTARIDDLGAGNVLSYLAVGAFNLGSRFTAKSALYLHQSRASFYNVELEFRPRERFLFRAAIGSFVPTYEETMMTRGLELESPLKDRFIFFFTRIWFGAEGAK
jgi:hypothetical protein